MITVHEHAQVHEHDPGFGATFASEWSKLRSARSPRRNLLLGMLLSIVLAGVASMAFGAVADDLSAAERADFDPLTFPLLGGMFGAIFFVAAAVKVVSSEYATGMMRLTLTATPRRHRVLLAKTAVVALATGIAGLVSTVGMLVVGQLVLRAYDAPSVGLGDGEVLRLLLTSTLVGPVFPVITVAVTLVFRSTAPSLTTVLALIFAPALFGELLPAWWQRNVLSLLPGPASDAVVFGHLDGYELFRHPVTGAVVTVLWMAAFLALAHLALSRRDA